MRLDGQVALITGGSRGIGRAIALRFAREGADLVVAARQQQSLRTVEREIQTLGRKVLAFACDCSQDHAVREMTQRAEERFGKIDILVHNAGYFSTMAPLHEMPDAEWDLALRTNLTGAFYVCRAVVPGMIARRQGSIILMSSIAAKAAFPFNTSYSASKAGLLGLTRALAAEVGPHGVRVNALVPGVVTGTDMHDRVNQELERLTGVKPEERLKAVSSAALLRRLAMPEDVAEAALFLACSESGIITGQTMNVDGGVRCD